MRPVNLTSATRRGARHDQQDMPAERGVGASSERTDPDENTQLTENLRRPPVREARLREPNVPIGVQIANVGRQVAHAGTTLAAISTIPTGLIALQAPFAAAYGYATDDPYLKNYAMVACLPVVASLSALGATYSVERLAAWYLQAQAQASVTKAARATELGTTEACLDAAIEMVTMPDAETPTPEMSEGERTALARDLLHLATADGSRLPPEIWSAASGVGDDAYTLVSNLLAAARIRASEEASASSAG
ncbi:type III secretion system effector XopAV [Xanthomonas campestris]|uniref:type III secretion system effector XopAV n=1 Tax=Xanthomonas campestris TaxID=339 RepID=UPI00235911A6|nr:type III secretion system effector XopAV [Xanthomonas campestris]